MPSIGSFGVARDEDEDCLSFEFFDLTPRIDPSFGQLDFIDFLEAAQTVDSESVQAMPVLKTLLRKCVHDDDFDAFWAKAREKRQSVNDLMKIAHAAIEAVAERPTTRSSDSSDGPPSTVPSSAADSSSRVITRLESAGRPDLANMALLRQEQMAG